MQLGSKEIRALTSIRFFAAALVVWEHLPMLPGLEWMQIPYNCTGNIGVTIFFVLSGFIMCYTYGDRDWTGRFGGNAGVFYWHRFARIYPLHWLMFFFALPLGLNSHTARVSVSEIPWQLTLTDMLWPGHHAGAQPVKAAWTLSCEALFYFLAPVFFLVLKRVKKPLAVSVLLLLGLTAAMPAMVKLFPGGYWLAYEYLPEFMLGMAGFHLARRINLARVGYPLLTGGVLLLLVATMVNLHWPCYLARFYYTPGALLIILGCANAAGTTGRILSMPLLVLLGHASYSLYLMHDPILRYLKAWLDIEGIVLPFPWNILIGAVVSGGIIVGSILCFKYYENPGRLKLRSWFERDTRPVVGTRNPSRESNSSIP
ncbi:MAG TPA: acyltransferase [Verrucomicrobiae bacterium]|nr:acyltransferase [Verrucomicrobiae bacterium]